MIASLARRASRLLLAAASLGCAGAAPGTADCRAGDPTIVGTWAVVGHVDDRDAGDTLRPARGYIVYDATGHLLAQVVHAPPAAASRHDWATAPQEQLVELLRGQTAFHGTYVVDTTGRRVVHRIVHESPPGPGEYEQVLPYDIDGDTLRVGGGSARQWVLRRVSPEPADACGDVRTTTDPPRPA